VVAVWKGHPFGEWMARLPQLKLASGVTLVFANLEHGDHNHFDLKRRGAGGAGRAVTKAAR